MDFWDYCRIWDHIQPDDLMETVCLTMKWTIQLQNCKKELCVLWQSYVQRNTRNTKFMNKTSTHKHNKRVKEITFDRIHCSSIYLFAAHSNLKEILSNLGKNHFQTVQIFIMLGKSPSVLKTFLNQKYKFWHYVLTLMMFQIRYYFLCETHTHTNNSDFSFLWLLY